MNLFIESFDYLDETSQRFYLTGSETPDTRAGGRRNTLCCAADTEDGWGSFITTNSGNMMIVGAAVAFPTGSGLGRIFGIGDPTASGYANVIVAGTDDGSLSVYRAPDVLLALSPAGTLRLDGVYQYVEAKVVVASGIDGVVQVRVNGQQVVTLNAVNTFNSGSLTPTLLTIYPQGRRRYDDLYINSGIEPHNFDFEGDVRIDTHYPNADTATIEWNRKSGTTNFEMVNEHPPDEDTTYNSTPAGITAVTDLLSHQDLIPVNAGIRAISVLVRSQGISIATTSGRMRALIKIGNVTYSGEQFEPVLGYKYYPTIWDVSPATTSGFVDAEFNAMTVGYRKDA